MGDARRMLEVQFKGLSDEQFVQAPVFAQDERIVEAGDKQNVLHPKGHQVFETFE